MCNRCGCVLYLCQIHEKNPFLFRGSRPSFLSSLEGLLLRSLHSNHPAWVRSSPGCALDPVRGETPVDCGCCKTRQWAASFRGRCRGNGEVGGGQGEGGTSCDLVDRAVLVGVVWSQGACGDLCPVKMRHLSLIIYANLQKR